MFSTHPLADAPARLAALDPSRSFIVQAPAGSGKTGLLTQRFLRLLALSDHPEEVVAVTYTRKAAQQMQDRILDAIALAAAPAPDDPHKRLTWELGREALQRDHAQGWRLSEHPGRLRVLTIDALCASLVRQAPALSGFGGRPTIAENPLLHYRRAAQAALKLADGDSRWAVMVQALLEHLDNNWGVAEEMLVGMLSRRDQWLRRIVGEESRSRDTMESLLVAIVEHGLASAEAAIPVHVQEELLVLTRFAAQIVKESQPNSPLLCWCEQISFPSAQVENLPLWLALGELLLTGTGTWRQRFDVRCGFPPATAGRSREEKQLYTEMKASATRMTTKVLVDAEPVRQALLTVRQLPPTHYEDKQWQILAILLQLLPMAAGQLKLIFAQAGEADFVEAAMGAATALGEPDAPSDLALRMDYRIRHILVDEFQDASFGQFDLLRRLTAGWTLDDGRTLFVVGDPMQSIYRFREADVGLFLKAQQESIGEIQLVPLSLSVNFRSAAGIVEWVNNTFQTVFPQEEDGALGAVAYTRSHAFLPAQPGDAVRFFPVEDATQEARQVVEIAASARSQGERVAVLVRSRSHVPPILLAMRQAGLRYRAVEIDPLSTRPVVRDLMTLTRALSHLADRTAWLALLRAPWCGMTLEDLHLLANTDAQTTLWVRINTNEVIAALTPDGAKRLLRVRETLLLALSSRRRTTHGVGQGQLRRWLETTWQELGGPATLISDSELADASAFFTLVESMERGGEIPDFTLFSSRLSELKAGVDPDSDPDLLIMTIHKAKGLEFDVVILPALHKRARGEGKPLLSWLEDPPGSHMAGKGGLLLAPVKRTDQDKDDPIQAYVRRIEGIKGDHETGRLLYVAATRACNNLYLLGQHTGAKGESSGGSFLARLLRAIPDTDFFGDRVPENPEEERELLPTSPPQWRRLTTDWHRPPPPAGVQEFIGIKRPDQTEQPVLFDWAGERVRLIGLLVHRYLMVIASTGLNEWHEARIRALQPIFASRLMQLGADREMAHSGSTQVMMALIQSVNDPRGRWILNPAHQEAKCEFAVTGVIEGQVMRGVMDRLFVDETETLWIIDFKTSHHAGGDLEGFLDNERIRYQDQLRRYGALISNMESRPIRLGLYFPLHSGWRECTLTVSP